MIDNFKLIRKISEDKLGAIYVAEQLAPPAKVLIKVYGVNPDTRDFCANIETEALNFKNIRLYQNHDYVYAVIEKKEYISELHQLELATLKKWEISQENILSKIDEITLETKNKIKPKTKANSWQPILKHALLTVFILGLSIAGVQALLSKYFNSVSEIKVPDISKLPLKQGEARLKKTGLIPVVVATIPSLDIPKDHIIDLFPEAGSIVKKGRRIRLKVSAGKTQLTVPDLVGRNVEQVKSLMNRMNIALDIVSDDTMYSYTTARGRITSQNIEANQPISEGESLTVYVSKGFPVNLSVQSEVNNTQNCVVKIGCMVLPEWPEMVIKIFATTPPNQRQIIFEEIVSPGDKLFKQFKTKSIAIIEVYYNNELAYKQALKEIIK